MHISSRTWAPCIGLRTLPDRGDGIARLRGKEGARDAKELLGLAVAASLAVSILGVGTASAADASLNVVHGIPGVDVDVCVNGAAAIPDFNPGEVVTGVPLPAGTYDVKIVAAGDACTDAAILEATGIELASGKNYTAIAYLMEDGTPTLGLFRTTSNRWTGASHASPSVTPRRPRPSTCGPTATCCSRTYRTVPPRR